MPIPILSWETVRDFGSKITKPLSDPFGFTNVIPGEMRIAKKAKKFYAANNRLCNQGYRKTSRLQISQLRIYRQGDTITRSVQFWRKRS